MSLLTGHRQRTRRTFWAGRALRFSIDLALEHLTLSWSDANGQPFASDLIERAYVYDRAGKSLYHYLEHRPDEHYYGFGERAGELDKSGRRMRLLNLDALGYSARTTDPLYKHFPFYLTFVPDLQIAYGLFYTSGRRATQQSKNRMEGFWVGVIASREAAKQFPT